LAYYLRGDEMKFSISYSQFIHQTLKNDNEFIFAAHAAH
jgi:hypothetical protein